MAQPAEGIEDVSVATFSSASFNGGTPNGNAVGALFVERSDFVTQPFRQAGFPGEH